MITDTTMMVACAGELMKNDKRFSLSNQLVRIVYQLCSVNLYHPNFLDITVCTKDIECKWLSDTCKDGTCLCGDSPACTSGQVCESGICGGTKLFEYYD